MPSPLNALISTDPPKPMGWMAALKALMPFGSDPQNIRLPSESGMRDPRLPPPDQEEQRRAFAEANAAALRGLRGVR